MDLFRNFFRRTRGGELLASGYVERTLNIENLEAEHDWFWLEVDIPDFFDAVLDLIFQGQYFGGGGAAAIYNRESVLARNAGVAQAVAAGESGLFYQPCR